MSLADNALLTAHRAGMVKRGFVALATIARSSRRRCIREYNVKCGGAEAAARSLSGGNLQKFIVGREIRQQPKVLIAAQPTWGVDVGAAAQIRQALHRPARRRRRGARACRRSWTSCSRSATGSRSSRKGRLSPTKPVRETNVEEIGVLMTRHRGTGADAESAQRASSPASV